jgi:hypothetical protein
MRTIMEFGRQVDLTDHYDARLEKLELKTINAVDAATPTDVPVSSNGWVDGKADWKDQKQGWPQ